MNYKLNLETTMKKSAIKLLDIKDSYIRISTLEQCRDAVDKGIHIGGAFSAVIPLVTLFYGGFIELNIADPTKEGQDIFILSKGHAVASLATIYADLGYFHSSLLKNSRSMESKLNGHPGPILPGIPISTGPLGQGLAVAQGFALAEKNGNNHDVYCMVGDGELQEGGIWEAVMYASHQKLDNLCVIIDKNNGQLDDTRQLLVPAGNLEERLKAFGWRVYNVDGAQYETIYNAFSQFKGAPRDGRPTVIISNCTKGQGGFSDFTNKHKVNYTDSLLQQEIQLQETRLNRRIKDFTQYINSLGDNKAVNEIISIANRMNIEIQVDELGNILGVKSQTLQVKTKRAPVRDKEIHYDESLLPKLQKGHAYTASQIISEVMKVFSQDTRIVTLDSDLCSTSGLQQGVASIDQTRALNVGIAEANMMNIGEAFAAAGCNVWVSTFCPFFEWRVLRRIAVGYQERIEAINEKDGWLNEGHGLDMTFVATAPNFETQTNGATHMGNDDITIFDGIAHLKIIDISCPQQLIGTMKWIVQGNKGLIYLRIPRAASNVIYDSDFEFEYGRGYIVKEHEQDEAIFISSGRGVYEAVMASEKLEKSGIYTGVVDMPSFDEDLLLSLADTGKILIFAEQNNGYLWSCFMKAVFKRRKNVNMDKLISINALDKEWNPQFIHSGTYEQLTKVFNLDSDQLLQIVRKNLHE